MVIGTGIDMVKVSRIEKIIETKGDKFYSRILTPNEIDYIYFKNENPQTISGLFASKEAVAKLLGRGIGIVNWKDIEILHDKHNKPYIVLHNEGENLRKELGIDRIHLSISHEKDYAIAMVIGETCKSEILRYAQDDILGVQDDIASLPKRDPDSHKGSYGRVGIIAGSTGMVGSACLSSMAALRSGAGLVYNIVPKSLQNIFSIKLIEAIILPIEDDNTGHFTVNSTKDIEEILIDKDVLVLGPGIGVGEEREKFVKYILLKYNKTIVLDADGLNCIAKNPSILSKRKATTIITPHPGEMARLLNTSIKEIQQNRIEYSKTFSNKYNIITILKGHETIVTNGEDIYINTTGNPGMATAGSGDVLTGILASFIAQGMDPYEASKLGVYIHGLAGDLAKIDKGEYSMVARDIIENIPHAIMQN